MSALKSLLKANPGLYLAARGLRHRMSGQVEPEIALLPFLVDRARAAVDVGANTGVYVEALVGLAPQVIAIEANPLLAADLDRLFAGKARIVNAAVSDQPGQATLRVPVGGGGLATIAAENDLAGAPKIETFQVECLTLDGMDLPPVGFLKVDIEGHELAALSGAMGLIARDRPTILIEAEERHRANAVGSIRALLEPVGYRGFMLDGGRLALIDGFDPAHDQRVAPQDLPALNAGRYSGRYINNFVFIA